MLLGERSSPKQGLPYHSVPLGMDSIYQFDRRLIRAVNRYNLIYRMSICSIWLGIARYIPYRQLVNKSVWTGKTNYAPKPGWLSGYITGKNKQHSNNLKQILNAIHGLSTNRKKNRGQYPKQDNLYHTVN